MMNRHKLSGVDVVSVNPVMRGSFRRRPEGQTEAGAPRVSLTQKPIDIGAYRAGQGQIPSNEGKRILKWRIAVAA
jgi:hypothetical protein